MSTDLIQYSYTAGEMSRSFIGRSDFEKYDSAVERATNFFVNYQGGLTSRAGSEFGDFILHDDKAVKQFAFTFAPDIANIYNMLFGDFYIRFIQENAYVVEGDVTITGITTANPGVVTATAHGYSNGDWLKLSTIIGMTELNFRTVEVANVTANTFELLDHTGTNLDTSAYTAYVSGGIANRIYTIASPYAAADLKLLQISQLRDTIRITHNDYKTRNLDRIDHTDWTITEEDFVNDLAIPAITSVTPSGTDNAGAVWGVTAVHENDEESLSSQFFFSSGMKDYTVTAGSAKVLWGNVSGARFYKVYRSQIVNSTITQPLNAGFSLGYIGKSFGTEFVDNNIAPDFAHVMPLGNNPFADGQVLFVDITAGGSGYSNADTISIGTGTGFLGYPIVDTSGAITAVIIQRGGKDFTTGSTVTFSGGTGATATLEVSGASGNNPATSVVYQQRQLYAATENSYLTFYGSRVGLFSNFDISGLLTDNDSYEHVIDSKVVMPIRHLIPGHGGLVAMAQKAIWRLTGTNTGSITPTDVEADPQSFIGASTLVPLRIDADILYMENRNTTARMLEYNDFSKLFKGEDRSILANHLFPPGGEILSWTYAAEPHKVVHAIRDDGVMLHFTVVKEQDVYGWCPATTKGLYNDTLSIEEGSRDVVYNIVTRNISGRATKFFEQVVDRNFKTVDDIWCLDSAVDLSKTYPAASLTVGAITGTGINFEASVAVFSAGNIGDIIRSGGGKSVITAFVDTTNVTCRIIRDITLLDFETLTDVPQIIPSGSWTMDTPVSKIGNLWHLEGEEVTITIDGDVHVDTDPALPKTFLVVNGEVNFPAGITGTRAVAGFSYECIMRTLPPIASDTVIEARRKKATGISVRRDQTRGLQVGATLDKLHEMKERKDEAFGEPTKLITDIDYMIVSGRWDEGGQTYVVQKYPLPAAILGHVIRLDVGDDAS